MLSMPATWQSIAAVGLLVLATLYVVYRGWRTLRRSEDGCACGDGACSASTADRLPKRQQLLSINVVDDRTGDQC